MFELLLENITENEVIASLVILASSVLLVIMLIKPLVMKLVKKTKTKADDEIAKALYGAIEAHKEEVNAIHRVARKAKEKKCQKS